MLGNRGLPEAWSCLCICQAYFLMTFAMGGIPHAGPRHRGTSWVAARVWRTLWKFQRLGVISLKTTQWKWVSSRLEWTTSLIFSSWGRCSRLTTQTSGTRSGGLRKVQSPWELLRGLSGSLFRRFRGVRPFVESVRNLMIPLQCWHGSWDTSGVSPG